MRNSIPNQTAEFVQFLVMAVLICAVVMAPFVILAPKANCETESCHYATRD